ncbi:phosphocarrier, HPr family [compost metagenome]
MQGRGFEALVANGERVERGQPLIRFDLDLVAQHCTSLITVIILSNSSEYRLLPRTTRSVALGAPLLDVIPNAGVGAVKAASAGETVRGSTKVAHHGGLHARPAALLRQTAQGFASHAELHFNGQVAALNSLVAIMGLGVGEQDEIEIVCSGADSTPALHALLAAVATATVGEQHAGPAVSVQAKPVANLEPGILNGVCASPGLASGPLARLDAIRLPHDSGGHQPGPQHQALNVALASVKAAIEADLQHLQQGDAAAIFEAHLALLDDPSLIDAARQCIDQGPPPATPGARPSTPSARSSRHSTSRCWPSAPTTCRICSNGYCATCSAKPES